MKKYVYLFMIIIIVTLNSCSSAQFTVDEKYMFNNIFLHNTVCENNKYVFYPSFTENQIDYITRVNKENQIVDNLNIKGYNLMLYGKYLYYSDNNYDLYRININNLTNVPQLVKKHVGNLPYLIVNKRIYFLFNYSTNIFSLDLEGKNEIFTNQNDIYFYCGIDTKYLYVIQKRDTESKGDNNRHDYDYSLTRISYNNPIEEELFSIKFDEWVDYRFNNFIIIHNNNAYYVSNNKLYKYKLHKDSNRELIYENTDYWSIIAINSDGIYLKKNSDDNNIFKITLDGKNEKKLNYSPNILYFISKYNEKLYCIMDNQIILVE